MTPLPPIRSGISAYSAEILPRLAAGASIDVYVDFGDRPGLPPRPEFLAQRASPTGGSIFSAHDFVWKRERDPYDLGLALDHVLHRAPYPVRGGGQIVEACA